ncbi:MAG: hypothetical protein KUG81_08190 [Gammaproteobacteria bacterium]|nr:hypothetical protein [Gammaproteobacteria bacterium]
MLTPFLPDDPKLRAALAAPRAPLTHFGERAVEYGIESIQGDLLKNAVQRAIAAERFEAIEFVFRMGEAARLYRILLPEGRFYPVISNRGVAMTIYPHSYVDRVRGFRKYCKRKFGKRVMKHG